MKHVINFFGKKFNLIVIIVSFLFLVNLNSSEAQNFAALGSGTNATVWSVLVFDGDLIVGGEFTTAGGVTVNRIAKWNGTNWSALGTGMNGSVRDLAIFNNELYAVRIIHECRWCNSPIALQNGMVLHGLPSD